jgi:hypothetical protein
MIAFNFRKIALRWALLFTVLFALTLQFEVGSLLGLGFMLAPLTESITRWLGRNVLTWEDDFMVHLGSDTAGLYIHTGWLLVLALALGTIWALLDKTKEEQKLTYLFMVFCRYYLAIALFKYGFVKVFHIQFFTPDPNTLYTPFGQLDRDILYWSTMGVSKQYNLFLGLSEAVAGILLLFRKTYLIGAFFSFGIMVNVVAVNLGFDISVKVFSTYLLLLSFILIAPQIPSLIRFFVFQQPSKIVGFQVDYPTKVWHRGHLAIKGMLIAVCLWEGLGFTVKPGLYHTPWSIRSPWEGAYQVMDASSASQQKIKRIFIHRDQYLITQDHDDQFQDYKFQQLSNQSIWVIGLLGERGVQIDLKDSFGDVTLYLPAQRSEIKLKRLAWQQLPALQNQFHWSVDEAVKRQP